MAIGAEVVAAGIAGFLTTVAPIISIILLVLGGIIYGVAQTQPAEVRGKWQTAAISMFVGGVIIAVIAGSAVLIQQNASGWLKPA